MKQQALSKFTYNIYSHTMGDFLFEKDLDNQTVSVAVPDGEYELFLYQTGGFRAPGVGDGTYRNGEYELFLYQACDRGTALAILSNRWVVRITLL